MHSVVVLYTESSNAPIGRYFNTLKNESPHLYEFRTDEELYQTVENSLMSRTIMYARTAIMATARHTRHERQHKDRQEHATSLDCFITPIVDVRFCQWHGRAAVRSTIDKT